MTKKDFSAMLNTSDEQKKELNLKIENQRLKETIKELHNYQNNVSLLKLSDIKLRNNIRDDYDFEEIEILANDISSNNQLQPVLITEDNYLLTGYRRYYALRYLSYNEILVYKFNKKNEEIDERELKEIQFAENSQRRNIDNFQLCNLFNWYIQQGLSQKDIAEKFKKSKGIISVILGIKNLDERLVKYIKEFQIYGVSYKKFVDTNLEQQQKYLDKKEIIGYRPLYNIAKLTPKEQKKAFLKSYGDKLTYEELQSKFFCSEVEKIDIEKRKNKYERALKSIYSLKEIIEKIKSENPYDDFTLAAKYLLEVEDIIIKNEDKIK